MDRIFAISKRIVIQKEAINFAIKQRIKLPLDVTKKQVYQTMIRLKPLVRKDVPIRVRPLAPSLQPFEELEIKPFS
jgi:hypothetical protein